jgi:prepilin-type N-terminal cleavage/methylation domain-containing protein/prepilin-type processing-associated H-X9-DG protein
MAPTKSRSSGFTLIELLVVIAIIAILAAILFPVFARARESARAITCVSNAKQIMTGTLMYSQDYDEIGPLLYSGLSRVTPGSRSPGYGGFTTDPNMYWPTLIAPYVQKAGQAAGGLTQNYDITKDSRVFICPSAPFPEATLKKSLANVPSLGISDNWAEWYCPSDCNNGYGATHSFVEAVAPANTIYYAETLSNGNTLPGFSLALTPIDGGNSGSTYYGVCNSKGYGKYSIPRMFPTISWRHTAQKVNFCDAPPGGPNDASAKVTVAYADGHVKQPTLGQLRDYRQWAVMQGNGDVGCQQNVYGDGSNGCWYP